MNAPMQQKPLEVRATPGQPLGMSPAHFLRDYWQKHPLLIRNAFADFSNPVAPDDLAGLACEELALARIAIHEPQADRWALRNGPFAEDDFAKLPKTHWTLLVQDVDKWDSDVAALLPHFSFLPSWRTDDVMVSYAADGGSVGAHVDQYDVFLLQGLGRRRWQIDMRVPRKSPHVPVRTSQFTADDFRDDTELKLLRAFTPTDEWTLEPGDMLYLPPGVPHHGIAIGECMTYSIGMRAPSQAELLVDFAETLAERIPETARLTDPDLLPARGDGEIDDAAIACVMQAMPWLRWSLGGAKVFEAKTLDPGIRRVDELSGNSLLLRTWFGRFITRYRSAHAVAPHPRPLTNAAFARALANTANVQRNPWSRFAWTREDRGAMLFVAGENHACSRRFARLVCMHSVFPITATPAASRDRGTLRALIDAGHLALERPRQQRNRG